MGNEALLEAVRDALQLRISDLRAELAATEDSLVEAKRDGDAYRFLAKVAMARIAELSTTYDRLRVRMAALADEERTRRQEAA